MSDGEMGCANTLALLFGAFLILVPGGCAVSWALVQMNGANGIQPGAVGFIALCAFLAAAGVLLVVTAMK